MNDIYTKVTNCVVDALESGAPPWISPWASRGSALPINFTSNRPYRGINVLLLYAKAQQHGFAENRWLTLRQTNARGGRVRKGERGTQVVFFKWLEVDDTAPSENTPHRVVPMLRAFTVFNLEQTEGVELAPPEVPPWSPEEGSEALLRNSGAVIRHGGNRACYSPSEDLIRLPPASWFANSGAYYATALHELTHWTGHPSRCNRPLGRKFGLEAYAFEELVAEMGAAFLCAHSGLPARMEHASYIDSWLGALRSDKRLIFVAAGKAQAAADYVLLVAGATPAPAKELLAA